jgi:hypothetical protein
MTKEQLLKLLAANGVKIIANKIPRSQLEKILGNTEIIPEWLSVEELDIKIPAEYSFHLSQDFKTHGRVYNPISLRLARFGKVQKQGQEIVLDGIVYQYCLKHNPRNIKYAYKLLANGIIVSENAALRSVLETESQTLKAARKFMEE